MMRVVLYTILLLLFGMLISQNELSAQNSDVHLTPDEIRFQLLHMDPYIDMHEDERMKQYRQLVGYQVSAGMLGGLIGGLGSYVGLYAVSEDCEVNCTSRNLLYFSLGYVIGSAAGVYFSGEQFDLNSRYGATLGGATVGILPGLLIGGTSGRDGGAAIGAVLLAAGPVVGAIITNHMASNSGLVDSYPPRRPPLDFNRYPKNRLMPVDAPVFQTTLLRISW